MNFFIGKFLSPLGLEPRTSYKPSPFLYHLNQASRASYINMDFNLKSTHTTQIRNS